MAVALAVLVVVSFSVDDFWKYDINYKNEKLDIHIPNKVDDGVAGERFTLPVIYVCSRDIDTLISSEYKMEGGLSMPVREESSVDLYIFDRDENSLEDIPSHVYYDEMMKLRGRSSSYAQNKKPFSLEFRDDEGMPVNYNFLDFAAESDFVFHAPYIDRSLVRNFVAYNLQMQITDWAPDCQFAEVFIDTSDGTLSMDDYQGVYLIVEKIKQDKNRIAMGEYKTPDSTDDIFREGGNIIWKLDHYEKGFDRAIRTRENRFGNQYSIAYPKAENVDDAAVDAINDELDFFETALYEGTDEEFAQYYDVEQIARVMLLTEFVKNYEGFTSSLYYYRPCGERIKAIQWDFDIGTGNDDYEADLSNADGFYVLTNEETQRYLMHPNFRNALIRQWKELRSEGGVFSEDNVIALLENAENQLDGAWQRNDEKYGYIFIEDIPFGNKTFGNNLENSQAEREYIKQFLIERGRWLDEHIDEIADF